MGVSQIVSLVIGVLQQFGLTPYIQAAMLVLIVIAVIAALRRSFSNS